MLPAYHSETEYEELLEAQEFVYSLECDADHPGSSGGFHVFPWKGAFIVVSEMGDETVYPSVEEAIVDGEINYVTSATTAVESSALSAEHLGALLTTFDGGHYQIEVNKEPWETGPPTSDGPRTFVRSARASS